MDLHRVHAGMGASSWRFELEIFPSRLPCGHPYRHEPLLRVSVTHRPALARSILGRWKERSLRMKPPSLPIVLVRNIQTDQRNQKHILTHWHPVQKWKQRRKTSFTRNPPEKEREINKRGKKYTQILKSNEFRTKAEEEKMPSLRNKTNARQKTIKTTERKAKPER